MWVMVLGDMVVFGGYFVIFMIYRAMTPEAFLASQQHLNSDIGVINTVIGLIVLGVTVRELRNPARRRVSMVESGAVYWHMVDMLWLVIFALMYVMR